MTKQEYIQWKQTRGPANTWDHATCVAADALIKRVTLETFREKMEISTPLAISRWALLCATIHFGSVETDTLMIELNCYPDWM